MKNLSWMIVVVTAVAAAAGDKPKNLLSNGSFENGLTGWKGVNVEVKNMPEHATTGKHILQFTPVKGIVSTPVKLTVGDEYMMIMRVNAPAFKNAFFCAYLNAEGPGEHPFKIIHQYNGGHQYGTPSSHAPAPAKKGWTKRRATFFAEKADNVLRIGPAQRWSGVAPGTFWIDDVVVITTGRTMTYGRDYEYRAILPSEAVVGKPVRLTVSSTWIVKGFRFGAPTSLAHEVNLACTDAKFTVPTKATFVGGKWVLQNMRVTFPGGKWALEHLQVTFNTPGVHRITVTDAAGNLSLIHI